MDSDGEPAPESRVPDACHNYDEGRLAQVYSCVVIKLVRLIFSLPRFSQIGLDYRSKQRVLYAVVSPFSMVVIWRGSRLLK